MTSPRFGVLLSSASQTSADDPVVGCYRTAAEAAARSSRILDAQPGIDGVLVMRRSAGAEWLGLDGFETAVEISRRLWG